MLQGKSALVTGSTSGIGLAIARALAAQGANITINGFGDKDAVEKERLAIEKDYKVKAIYSPADMSKPGDIAELVASPFKVAYVSAKHGLAGLTKTVALELATFGVTCNCISPGYVWTPLVEKQIPDTAKARGMTEEQVKRDVLLAAQPTKEFVTVDEVADLAVYLCSDAAKAITGANLSIDGGWTAA
jgi:NAD(P)-dependent dehydrogenase (short-subunit alcohol dehydrogenase family)